MPPTLQKILMNFLTGHISPKEQRRKIRKIIEAYLDPSSFDNPTEYQNVREENQPNGVSPYHDAFKIQEELLDHQGKVIFIIDHNWGGGANFYREKQIENFLNLSDAVVLATCATGGDVDLELRIKEKTIKAEIHSLLDLVDIIPLGIDKIIVNELVSWRKSGNSCLSLPKEHVGIVRDIPEILEQIIILSIKKSVPIVHCFHDYFPLCPAINLINSEYKYCGVVKDDTVCMDCLSKHPECLEKFLLIGRWREAWQYYFDHVENVIFFSSSAASIAKKIFSFRDTQVKIIPHEPLIHFNRDIVPTQEKKLRIGVIGNILKYKGADILIDLAGILKEYNPDAQIVVIGKLYAENIPKNIIVHGAYSLEKLPDLIEQYEINIGCIPAIWPETFSYTTQELMELNIPTVSFDLGAPAERLSKWERGEVVTEISAQFLYIGIKKLHEKIYGGI